MKGKFFKKINLSILFCLLILLTVSVVQQSNTALLPQKTAAFITINPDQDPPW